MDKYLLPVIIIAVALLAAMFAGCTGTPPEDVPDPDRTYYIVGIDEFYPPYTFLGGTGNPEGFDVESMEWIARDQGLDIRFKVRDWYGILPDLLDKRIDIIYSGYSITPDRAKIIAFSDPYWVVSQGVVVKRGSKIKYEDVISGKVITGTEAKSTADDWIQKYLVDIGALKPDKFKQYGTFHDALDELERGNIEAVIYDAPGLIEAIEDRNLEYIGSIKTGEKYGIAVRKEDKELLEKLNAGLKHLTESPKWAELIAKYELKEIK